MLLATTVKRAADGHDRETRNKGGSETVLGGYHFVMSTSILMDEFPVRDRSLLPSLAAAHKSERVGVMDPGRAGRR